MDNERKRMGLKRDGVIISLAPMHGEMDASYGVFIKELKQRIQHKVSCN